MYTCILCLLEGNADKSGECGMTLISNPRLDELVQPLDKKIFQHHIIADGNRALKMALNGLDKVKKSMRPEKLLSNCMLRVSTP